MTELERSKIEVLMRARSWRRDPTGLTRAKLIKAIEHYEVQLEAETKLQGFFDRISAKVFGQ